MQMLIDAIELKKQIESLRITVCGETAMVNISAEEFKKSVLRVIDEQKVVPKFSETDFVIEFLQRLKKAGYAWITRDLDGKVFARKEKPCKTNDCDWWFPALPGDHLIPDAIIDFPEIQWSDEVPTGISEVIEVYKLK